MKNVKSLALVATVMVLNSCVEDQMYDEIQSTKNQLLIEDIKVDDEINVLGNAKVCLDKTVDLEKLEGRSGKALLVNKLWENGKTIKIEFLGGSETLQERVLEKAKEYETYANIKFEVVTSGNSDIRVAFEQTGASWSYLGTDATRISDTAATINFGWFTDATNDDELSRVALHEFGHALGAIHEHQSPVSIIQWDEDYVVDYYYDNFGWSESQVFRDVLSKYDQSLITNSVYDPKSIMQYAIDAKFTLDGYSTGWNYYLSDLDKKFIGEVYPFEEVTTQKIEEQDNFSGINLALGKETSQLSTHHQYPGESNRAVDGDTSGKWNDNSITRTATDYRPWWQVRLGTEYKIGNINIWNRTDNCCAYKLVNFDVFVYNDKGEQVYKIAISEVPSPNIVINTGGVIGSRVRVKLKGTDQLSLAEVEVYGY